MSEVDDIEDVEMTGELPEALDGREPMSEILAIAGIRGLGSGEASLLPVLLRAA